MHTANPDAGSPPAASSTERRSWLVGLSAAVVMEIAAFVPWLADQRAGIYMPFGQLAVVAASLSVLAWLTHRRRIAGLVALGGAGFVAWSIADGRMVEPAWGAWMFVIAGGVALLASLPGARPEAREGIARWIDHALNPTGDDDRGVDGFIITLIALNVVAVMLETEPDIAETYKEWFLINETISTAVFSIEYLLRIWVAPRHRARTGREGGRLAAIASPMAIVDLVAIAPFFLQFIQMDLRIARAIRLLRLLRILKMGRYAHAVRTLANVIERKVEELAIAVFVSVLVLVLCSSAMYFAEHSAQPEAFRSIPATMWWAVVTLTSVGYGDVSPITGPGKVVGAVVCMAGVLVVALPTAIIASGFLEEMRAQRRASDAETFGFCPHCGEQLMPDEELE